MKMKIIVVGAGFSGLQTVKNLKDIDAEILVFDKYSYTTMKPVLPDVAGGKVDKERAQGDISKQLPVNSRLVVEEITKIDFNDKKVYTENESHDYDYLVLASGAVYKSFSNVIEMYCLNSLSDACDMNSKFKHYIDSNEQKNLLIIGTGYTGIETAYHLHKMSKDLGVDVKTIFVDKATELLPFLDTEQKGHIDNFLKSETIYLDTVIEEFYEDKVVLSNGETINKPFVVNSTGTYFPIKDVSGDYDTIRDGRIIVNEYLQIPQHKDVFVVGDCAAIKKDDNYLRKSVNYARESGKHAALNIKNLSENKSLEPFNPKELGWMLPLGKTSVGQTFF